MSTKLYTQDNYETEMTSPVTSASGDIEVVVRVAPTYTRWYVFLGQPSNPEVSYFYNRIGTTLYIAGPSRTNASTHADGDPVSISNCAALINRLEDNSVTTHTPEITGMLTINVFGGPFSISGTDYTAADEEITVADNTTTYVYLRFSDWTVQQSTVTTYYTDNTNAEYGQLLFTVITAWGRITAITRNAVRTYLNYNDINLGGVNVNTPTLTNSYIDTLTPDTIDVGATMPIFNSADTVDKQVTIEDIFIHAQDQGYIEPWFVGYSHTQASSSSTWTITHNLNSISTSVQCFDDSTPAELLIPDTITRNLNSIVLTFAGNSYAGSAIVGTPAWAAAAVGAPSVDFIAGEDMAIGEMVRMGISGRDSGINSSYIPSPVTTTFDTVTSSKALYQTFKAQRDTATKIQLYIKKSAAPDSTSLTVEIYATTTQVISSNTYNVPTGAALATGTIASWAFSTTAGYVTCTLSSPLTSMTPGSYYAIKITATGSESVLVGYGTTEGVAYLTNGFQFVSSLVPIVGDFAFKVQHADVAAEVTSRVYLASAFETATSTIIGATKTTASALGTVRVETHTATGFTGLTEGIQYYLSDIPGDILNADTATNTIEAGIPLSTTSLIIR